MPPNNKASFTATGKNDKPRKVAVIGGGVAGLAAAWHLHTSSSSDALSIQVTILEAEAQVGGHAHTCTITTNPETGATTEIDCGFMVFNPQNYPNMLAWFEALQVETEQSDMSLSVSLDQGETVEWSSNGLSGLLAKPSQAVSPAFYSFLSDMMRFNATAAQLLTLAPDDPRAQVTMGQYLRQHGYRQPFLSYYLLPMMAAIWSANATDILDFPALQLVSFLCNHKMLQLFDRPVWQTVKNRSVQYTQTVAQQLGPERALVHCHVLAVSRLLDQDGRGRYQVIYVQGPPVDDKNNNRQTHAQGPHQEKIEAFFDDVVFACHPPTAATLLRAGLDNDRLQGVMEVLPQIVYADNAVYVHSDPALMPKRKAAWASWNCMGVSSELAVLRPQTSKQGEAFEGGESGFGNTTSSTTSNTTTTRTPSFNGMYVTTNTSNETDPENRMKAVYVTYWLNRLQNLTCPENVFISLNPHTLPDPKLVYKRLVWAHPQYTAATVQARQVLLEQYQGVDGLWFCGAWAGYGFHEDGCRSGFQVATAMTGIPLPWCPPDASSLESLSSQQESNNGKDDNTSMSSTSSSSLSAMVLAPPDLSRQPRSGLFGGLFWTLYQTISRDLPIAVCKRFITYFLKQAVQKGRLRLVLNDGTIQSFGDGTPVGCGDHSPVTMRIFDDWFFVKTALEYDLGLARSYMAGHFTIQPLDTTSQDEAYHPVMRPAEARDETSLVLGDPIGLTRLFLLLIGNRDHPGKIHVPRKAGRGHVYANAMTNASGLVISKIGSLLNYLRYKLLMDNSERGGSLKNIHAHYDLSNDLFTSFLDRETLMYSSAVYDAVPAPSPYTGLVFRGSLEEAQRRKLDTLLARAQIQPGQTMLDIGFGWGGLTIHAAKKYGCRVTGITLSVEQKALAERRVKEEGLESLVTFEVCDYRTFARRKENQGKFDRVLSCEMIEAVGHEHLGEFFWVVEQVLAPNGILVMEAITTPEQRYETYLRSTDFINTIIFPGSCCPSLHALVDAAYKQSCLTLEHIDNIALHYAQTLAEWRRRFNENEALVRSLGFDDIFLRAWNYYLTYCEAGFFSQTENCLILVFSRQGCSALAPLCETQSVTQATPLTNEEIRNWILA